MVGKKAYARLEISLQTLATEDVVCASDEKNILEWDWNEGGK